MQVVLAAGYLAVSSAGVGDAGLRGVASSLLMFQASLYAGWAAAAVAARPEAATTRTAWRLLATGCFARSRSSSWSACDRG